MLQAKVEQNRSRFILILASPIVVVLLGDWAWVGTSLVYWEV